MEKLTMYLSSGQTVVLKAKKFTVVRDGTGHFSNLKWEGDIHPVPMIWPSSSEVAMITVV